jgi:hypothetical protein
MMRWVLAILVFSYAAFSAQVISEKQRSTCEEFLLMRELKIYKDPTLFLPNLSLIYSHPRLGWESLMNESPLLTTLKGTVHFMILGEPQEFRNFGAISKVYELADSKFIPRPTATPVPPTRKGAHASLTQGPNIIPIKICGDSYGDTLGFVLESDLKIAQTDERDGTVLPPSTRKNAIPKPR